MAIDTGLSDHFVSDRNSDLLVAIGQIFLDECFVRIRFQCSQCFASEIVDLTTSSVRKGILAVKLQLDAVTTFTQLFAEVMNHRGRQRNRAGLIFMVE